MDCLVTYDIGDTAGAGAKRLRAVHDLCCGFGERVQFSVFECRLSTAKLAALKFELLSVIDTSLDSVIIYRFAKPLPECKTVLGRNSARELGDPWLL